MNAATRAVLDYLRTQADVIATRADDVLIDAPDAVHRSRVATRRTRSALRTFAPLFKKGRERVPCATNWPGTPIAWARRVMPRC